MRTYFDVSLALTDPEPKFNFYDPHTRVFTHPRFLPGSHIRQVQANSSIVSEGCRIENAKFERSIVGACSILREEVELQETVLIGADYYETDDQVRENRELQRPDVGIGSETHIQRAIIDKNARIGHGVRIEPPENAPNMDGDGWAVRDGVVIVEKDAIIPDGSVLP